MFLRPHQILDELNLVGDEFAIDLGCGTGTYTLPLAERVHEVVGIDVQKDLLSRVESDARKAGLGNVRTCWADAEVKGCTALKNSMADIVLIANVLFQVENKEAFLEEARRLLSPGGKVALIDWSDSFGGLGPQQADVYSEDKAKDLFATLGFTVERSIDAGDHHYGFIARI